jgi:monovalent cation:H+ antiporter-2, CPA2 family
LTPVVAFLAAGVLIGPHGLALVRDMALIDALAEIGVLLLLFTIGMELSLERLAAMRWLVVGGGSLQMLLSGGATAGILVALGAGWRAAVFTGALVALSSTVIVLKLLGDRQELDTPLGRNALGILLFQDLAIVVLMLVLPVLAEGGAAGGAGGGTALLAALARGAAVVAVAVVVARRVMPPILEAVARTCSPETFLLTVLAIGLGTAWLTSLAGVSLSLGAFLAGLMVSESRFSDQAVAEILPFQILFSAIFFVSVGLLLDVGFVVANVGLVLAVVAAVLVVKAATGALAVRLLGQPWGTGLATGLVLAQVGEFSFVLERAGRGLGLAPAGMAERGSQSFIAAVVLLMVATPLLVSAARRAARLGGRWAGAAALGGAAEAPPPGREAPVALLGWGPVAGELARLLAAEGRPVVVVTLSPDGAATARAAGHRVVLGDYSKQAILDQAGVREAAAVVIAEDEPRRAEQLAALLHARRRRRAWWCGWRAPRRPSARSPPAPTWRWPTAPRRRSPSSAACRPPSAPRRGGRPSACARASG